MDDLTSRVGRAADDHTVTRGTLNDFTAADVDRYMAVAT